MRDCRQNRVSQAWLQLVRLPNLPTVPGDPVVGFLLASNASGVVPSLAAGLAVVAAAVFLYMAGLIWNDLADHEEDLIDRPQRPLPAGTLSRRSVSLAGFLAVALGIGLASAAGVAALVCAVVLVLLIALYDFVLKRYRLAGSIVMGACRGMSVMLGASVVGKDGPFAAPVLAVAVAVTLYIGAVTWIAARETVRTRIGWVRWLPAGVIALALVVFFMCSQLGVLAAATFFGLGLAAVVFLGCAAGRLGGSPGPQTVSATIGLLIRGLILIQAAFCAAAGGPGLAAAVVLLSFGWLSARLAGSFYSS